MILLRSICWWRNFWSNGFYDHSWNLLSDCRDVGEFEDEQDEINKYTTLAILTPSYRKEYKCTVCGKRKYVMGWDRLYWIPNEVSG